MRRRSDASLAGTTVPEPEVKEDPFWCSHLSLLHFCQSSK